MTTAKTLRTALWDEPIAIAIDQPHQILLSTGSVALMAGFASSVNIVHPLVGLVIAVGIEWAWLRGVASDASKPTPWGTALNVSAFVLAAVWGVLLVAKLLHAYDPETWGWWMAVIHVVPLIWLSLCSAMCHRSKLIAEAAARVAAEKEADERAKRLQAEADKLAQDVARERARIQLGRERRAAEREDMQMQPASVPNAGSPRPREEHADRAYRCPACGASLSVKQYAAARRWQRCGSCPKEA